MRPLLPVVALAALVRVLYAASPRLRVFDLAAATGVPKWSFDPNPEVKNPIRTRIRGLMYWERGDERRRFLAARQWLYALDARTGRPVPGFGRDGRIDLRAGVRRPRAAVADGGHQHAGRLLQRPDDRGLDRARGPALGARRHPGVRQWGGTAYDPRSGLLYVNANEMA